MASPRISRRTFALAGASASLLGLWATWKWNRGDPSEIVIAILKRRVGHLRVDEDSFDAFAVEYVKWREEYIADLKHLSVTATLLRFFTPYAWLKLNHPLRRLEDNVVSEYLLSTDFFENGANDRRLVKYVAFYDPPRTVCRNPFIARRNV